MVEIKKTPEVISGVFCSNRLCYARCLSIVFVLFATMYVPNIAVAASKSAANEPMIAAAGFNKRYPVSIPHPYIVHKTVSATKVPPVGIAPSKNESTNAKKEIFNIGKKSKGSGV